MYMQEVYIEKADKNKAIAESAFLNCNFCDKITKITNINKNSCKKLSGSKFYCPFCLRNNHNYKSSINILPISFRGIIGYYYYKFYKERPRKLYVSQIKNYIDDHFEIGIQNPSMSYDFENFMWYLNFNIIGKDKRKAPIEEINITIQKIIKTFNIKNIIDINAEQSMCSKFYKAINLFYQERKRPKNKKFLIPTFSNIVSNGDKYIFENTRNFYRDDLIV